MIKDILERLLNKIFKQKDKELEITSLNNYTKYISNKELNKYIDKILKK